MGRRRSGTRRIKATEFINHSLEEFQPFDSRSNKKRRNRQRLIDLPTYQRGPAQNRYGGHRNVHMKAFRGSKFGAANEGRVYTEEEKQEWAKQHPELNNPKKTYH